MFNGNMNIFHIYEKVYKMNNRTVSRALQILKLLAQEKKGLTLSEISRELDIPVSSTHDIVYTLEQEGFLCVNKELKTFAIGLSTFEIGASYLANVDLYSLTHRYLEEMMQQTESTTFLAVESRGEIVYLDKVESSTSVRTTAQLGSRNMLHYTGLGKALLATYDERKVREITGSGPLPVRTQYTIGTFDELMKELERIRQRGYAIDDRESEEEVFCVAAPLIDSSNVAVAAISIASLYTKMHKERQEYFAKLVVDSAMSISKILGFRGEKLYA
jgi:DNA-binding IclR family transcriptional regulator